MSSTPIPAFKPNAHRRAAAHYAALQDVGHPIIETMEFARVLDLLLIGTFEPEDRITDLPIPSNRADAILWLSAKVADNAASTAGYHDELLNKAFSLEGDAGKEMVTFDVEGSDFADPLLTLVAEYRDGKQVYNDTPEPATEEGDAELCGKTWRPPWERLKEPPQPTSSEGVKAAISLILEEEDVGPSPLTEPLLKATLAFLEGRVA